MTNDRWREFQIKNLQRQAKENQKEHFGIWPIEIIIVVAIAIAVAIILLK